MKNDRQDLERLTAIVPEELFWPLAFVELSPVDGYPQDLDFSENYKQMEAAIVSADEGIDTYAARAEEDREELRNESYRVLDEVENLNVLISDITLLMDEDGNAIYAEGRAKLDEELLNYTNAVTAERQRGIKAFQWAAQRDTLASASNAEGEIDPNYNIWIDRIRQEHLRQRREWMEDHNSGEAATPSNASPSNATPSDASPANATPANADEEPVTSAMDIIRGKIEEELTELIMDETDMTEVLNIVRRYCSNDYLAESIDPILGINEEPDAVLNQVSEEMILYFQNEMDYLSGLYDPSTEIFDSVFEEYVMKKLDRQEEKVQRLLTKQLNQFESEFEKFEDKLNEYDPFYDLDRGGIRRLPSIIRGNLSDVERGIHEKVGKDSDLIRKIEQGKDSDINALQVNLDQSYEITASNVTGALEKAKAGRKELNEENKELLYDFTQKLPYTWKGSGANTSTYDFIVNPIEINEKKLTGSPLLVKTQSVFPGNWVVIGILVILIFILAVQNERLRRRYGKESAKQG